MNQKHSPRASISFPLELYSNLEHIAKQKEISIAWVVRDAAEIYFADQRSLFKNELKQPGP